MLRKTVRRIGFATSLAAMVMAGTVVMPAVAADPPFIDPSSDWLTTVNYFRAMANLGPVVENPTLSAGAVNHSCYMLQNGITHDENSSLPGYTPSGAAAGSNGNVAVSSKLNTSARSHVELWMTGPFHAIGILRPNLQSVGFGVCNQATTPTPWHSGATLDVLHGLGATVAQSDPIVFPGNGTSTSLSSFITESPNPIDFCGWPALTAGQPAFGLPILALMPQTFSGNPTATITNSNGTTLEACVLSPKNTTGVAQLILNGNNAVVVIPRVSLAADTYAVSVHTSTRDVAWSFTVDPTAATGIQSVPVTKPLGAGVTLHILNPTRIVDTRQNLGSTPLVGTLPKRIQITGRGGVPDGAQAVSANFTIIGSARDSYLTVWNCSTDRPVVSTLNFVAGEAVPNGASVPLDATGGLCAYSEASTDLIIDVNAYYGAGDGGGRFSPVPPARLMDTRVGLGAPGRMSANTVVALQVTGVAGVPVGAAAVALNVTSVDPSLAGYVTVYPCGTDRPVVSSLNPVPGMTKPNVVISPVADDGTICLYTLTDVDLIVDVTGYVMAKAALKFTATQPFRFTDTRDRNRTEINAGSNGNPLGGTQVLVIQVAGVRNIPTNVKAISANFTVVGGGSPGYLTAWPCGQQPTTSTVNFSVGTAVANGAQMPLSDDGKLCVYASNSVHVIVDINGYWS